MDSVFYIKKKVNNMKKLKCHCGSIEAEIIIENLNKFLRCNCSLCRRKGAIMSIVKNQEFKITKGKDKLAVALANAKSELGARPVIEHKVVVFSTPEDELE